MIFKNSLTGVGTLWAQLTDTLENYGANWIAFDSKPQWLRLFYVIILDMMLSSSEAINFILFRIITSQIKKHWALEFLWKRHKNWFISNDKAGQEGWALLLQKYWATVYSRRNVFMCASLYYIILWLKQLSFLGLFPWWD